MHFLLSAAAAPRIASAALGIGRSFQIGHFFIADLLEFCHHILKGLVARSLLIDGFDLSALLRRSALAGGLLMRSVLLTLSVARGTWSALRTVAAVIVGIELLYRKGSGLIEMTFAVTSWFSCKCSLISLT